MSDFFTFHDMLEPPSMHEGGLADFDVDATDGHIGKIAEAYYGSGESYLVVHTGPWVFSKAVVLPAGVIERIDRDRRRVYLNKTKDEIKAAPEFDERNYQNPDYHAQLERHYREDPGRKMGDVKIPPGSDDTAGTAGA